MPSRHFNLESNEIHLSSTPLRGATVAVSVLGKLNMPLLLDPRFFISPWDDWHWELDDIVKQVFFHYATVIFELEKDSQWDSNPHVKYPQVPHFMGGVEPPEAAQLDTPIEGARLSISPWEIEKVFLKGNLSWSGQHGSITPLLFLIPET